MAHSKDWKQGNLIDLNKYKTRNHVVVPNALQKIYPQINLWNKIYGGDKQFVPPKAKTLNISDTSIQLANKMVQDIMMDFDVSSEERVEYIKAIKQAMLVYAGAINRTEVNLQEASRMVRVICMAIEFRRMMSMPGGIFRVSYQDLLDASERFNLIYNSDN